MDAKRYIIVPALIVDNKIIPIWDEKIKAEKSKDIGEYYSYDNSYFTKYFILDEVIFDVKTKKLSMGIVLKFYTNPTYEIGEKVMHEVSNHTLTEVTIKDIVYTKYRTTIKKGSKLDKKLSDWYKPDEKNVTEINPDSLYAIQVYEPSYIFDNGKRCDWSHELYKIKG